jgi:hypothetical protein
MSSKNLIVNLYENSKICSIKMNKIRECRNKLQNDIITFFNRLNINVSSRYLGSYAMYLNADFIDDNSYDIDIGYFIETNDPNFVLPLKFRERLAKYIMKNNKIHRENIKIKHFCISIKSIENVHFDIVIFLKKNGNDYVLQDDMFQSEPEQKTIQILKLKDAISGNENVKKIIIFLKYVCKTLKKIGEINEDENYLAGIVITELVTQNYKDLNTIDECLIETLNNIITTLSENFVVINSGNKTEDLINNSNRSLNKAKTIELLQSILHSIRNIDDENSIFNKIIMSANDNKYMMLEKSMYNHWKMDYKNIGSRSSLIKKKLDEILKEKKFDLTVELCNSKYDSNKIVIN